MLERIHLYRTQEEWDAIDAKVKSMGRKDFKNFLRSEIFKLNNRFESGTDDFIDCATNKKTQRQVFVTEEELRQLRRLSVCTKKSINTVVNEFILSPLLQPDKA